MNSIVGEMFMENNIEEGKNLKEKFENAGVIRD